MRTFKPMREFADDELRMAEDLYRQHGPYASSRITKLMRDAGFKKFVVADLDGRPLRKWAGLIEIHGWKQRWHPDKITDDERSIELAKQRSTEQETELPAVVPTDFVKFLEASRPKWKWRWKFQQPIYRELKKITANRGNRLMVFMPPRHGKSELVTIGYATWRLLLDPSLRIIIGSYNQRLANKFSRRIRSLFLEWSQTETVENFDDSKLVVKSVDEWETTAGGGVKAVGVGAGVTGYGADLIIIDDPIKSRAEAESSIQRDSVMEWFADDLMTRLEPNGSVVLIQTRWHEDDLAGRLLDRQGDDPSVKPQSKRKRKAPARKSKRRAKAATDPNEFNAKWSVVKLPALAEENDPLSRKVGAALFHERFPQKALLKKKAEMGSYSFSALYQQSPSPYDGSHFKRSWFADKTIDKAPENLRWCRGYDLAVSTKTTADYTASFRCAMDKLGNLYIADGFRKRIEFPEQRRYIIDRIKKETDTQHGIELAIHGLAVVQDLRRDKRLASSVFRGVRVDSDKVTRALAWANRAEEGKVFLVKGPWIDAFLDELCRFPTGKHDDQIDAVGIAVRMLSDRKKSFTAF